MSSIGVLAVAIYGGGALILCRVLRAGVAGRELSARAIVAALLYCGAAIATHAFGWGWPR